MPAPRSYEIRLFDRTLVEFTLSDGLLASGRRVAALDSFMRRRVSSDDGTYRLPAQY